MPRHTQRGQTVTEAAVVLPLFLLFVFGLLQMAQVGYALIMVNYSAWSIAHRASREEKNELFKAAAQVGRPSGELRGVYLPQMDKFLMAGLHGPNIRACVDKDGGTTGDLTIWTSGSVTTLPLVQQTLYTIFKNQPNVLGVPPLNNCDDNNQFGLGIFYFGSHAETIMVRGKARVRLNYGVVRG